MHRYLGALPLAVVIVAATAAAAVAVVQDDPFASVTPAGPWSGDRSTIVAVPEADRPQLECADREPMEVGIFDYAADPAADELDPLQRAQSVLTMSVDPSIDPATATWVDVGPMSGVVTFVGPDGRIRALVHFDLWEPGWRVGEYERCVPLA